MVAPRILISGSDGDRGSYERAVIAAGGIPVSGYCPRVDLTCDGLLLCGGDDVGPIRFGRENTGAAGIDAARDQAELDLVAAFMAAKKPVFGICRGQQILNVALGGTLIQDLSAELRFFHTHAPGEERDKIHPVWTAEGSLLRRLYGPVMAVNSSHHQAVERLGAGFSATAWSESGLVESVEHDHLPILGVQFHPERMAYSRRRPDTADGSFLFELLIRRCGGE